MLLHKFQRKQLSGEEHSLVKTLNILLFHCSGLGAGGFEVVEMSSCTLTFVTTPLCREGQGGGGLSVKLTVTNDNGIIA